MGCYGAGPVGVHVKQTVHLPNETAGLIMHAWPQQRHSEGMTRRNVTGMGPSHTQKTHPKTQTKKQKGEASLMLIASLVVENTHIFAFADPL